MTHVCSTEGLDIYFSVFDSIYTLSIWIRISILMSTLVIIHRLAKYLVGSNPQPQVWAIVIVILL